jgi:hypothetical protein
MNKNMRASTLPAALLAAASLAGGCASLPAPEAVRAQDPATDVVVPAAIVAPPPGKEEKTEDKKDDEKDKDEPKGPPKTLFDWAIGPDVPDEPDEGPEPIVTDRPDFTEASSTVGVSRVQLEAGYTYYRDRSGGSTRVLQSYPEALLRIGAFADWFELRLGQNYFHSRTTFGAPTEHLSGLSDLYVGAKLGLTEQKAHLPEMALVLQALVPTGARGISQERFLPGFNFLYGWDVIEDLLSAGGSFQANRLIDDEGHPFLLLAQSFTIGYTLTTQLGAYTEWFALYPHSAVAPGTTAQHYVNGGFTYKVTPDFQLDVRVGRGLSNAADDLFAGAGFAVRY